MAYRENQDRTVKLASLTGLDWLIISAMLALGAATFFLLFHLFAWLVGWPGPYLWFGSSNRFLDVMEVTLSIALATFFLNLIGAFFLLTYFAIRGWIRGRTGAN